MSYLRRGWKIASSAGTVAWLWQLGLSSVFVALVGWGIWVLDVMPRPLLILLLIGLFLLSLAALPWIAARARGFQPAGAPADGAKRNAAPRIDHRAAIQQVRLIRNEIDEGTRIVSRAVGVHKVYDVVSDVNWIAHHDQLAAIPDGGDAHRLAGLAWEGFRRYNYAVKGRTEITDAELTEATENGRRAVEALNVLADVLRSQEQQRAGAAPATR